MIDMTAGCYEFRDILGVSYYISNFKDANHTLGEFLERRKYIKMLEIVPCLVLFFIAKSSQERHVK